MLLCFCPHFYHSFQKTVKQKNTHLTSNQVKYSVQLRNKLEVQLLIIALFETFQANEISASSRLARLFIYTRREFYWEITARPAFKEGQPATVAKSHQRPSEQKSDR